MCLLRRLLFSVMVETISEDMAATRFSSEFHCDRQTLQLFRCDNGYPGNSLASALISIRVFLQSYTTCIQCSPPLSGEKENGKITLSLTPILIYKLVTLKRRFEPCQCEYCDSQKGILLKYEFLKNW